MPNYSLTDAATTRSKTSPMTALESANVSRRPATEIANNVLHNLKQANEQTRLAIANILGNPDECDVLSNDHQPEGLVLCLESIKTQEERLREQLDRLFTVLGV